MLLFKHLPIAQALIIMTDKSLVSFCHLQTFTVDIDFLTIDSLRVLRTAIVK